MASKSNAIKRSEAPASASGKASKPVSVPRVAGNEDAGFDRLIYERVRLGIMSALAMNERLTPSCSVWDSASCTSFSAS